MVYAGPGPYYAWTTASDGPNNKNLQTSSSGTTNIATVTTNQASAVTFLMKPLTTGTVATYTTTGQDFGWNMGIVNTDPVSNLPAVRTVEAGTWSFQAGIQIFSGLGFPVGGSVTCKVNVYARSSSSLRYLGTLTGSAQPVASQNALWTASASFSQVVLANGETIQLELWWTVPAGSAGQAYQLAMMIGHFTYGAAGVSSGDATLTLPGQGLRFQYPRSFSVSNAGTVSLTRQTAKAPFSLTGTGVLTFTRAATLARTFSTAGTGLVSLTKQIAKAPFSISGTGVVSWLVLITQAVLNRITGSGVTPDWPLNAPTKAVAGTVRDEDTGVPISGATVKLVRDIDEVAITQTTSAADGTYSFTRGGDDPYTYHCYSYLAGTTEIHGVTDRGVAPA